MSVTVSYKIIVKGKSKQEEEKLMETMYDSNFIMFSDFSTCFLIKTILIPFELF